jgi:anti-anti-sigma regulatory factor
MIDGITASASVLTSRYRQPMFDCGGAVVSAHCRHLATVVTVQGDVNAGNVDRVSEYTRRYVLADAPLVLDLTSVNSFVGANVSLLHRVDRDCRAAGMQWALVASQVVAEQLGEDEATLPVANSVHEALRHFADVIGRRRQLLLPLIKKSA